MHVLRERPHAPVKGIKKKLCDDVWLSYIIHYSSFDPSFLHIAQVPIDSGFQYSFYRMSPFLYSVFTYGFTITEFKDNLIG